MNTVTAKSDDGREIREFCENNRRLLIVEDSKDIQILLRHLLKGEGYQVDAVDNGEEALKVLRASEKRPNLILLDLMMPVMNGYQFRAEQQKDPNLAQIPVVVMTAFGDSQSDRLGVDADAFLKKPFSDVDKIFDVIEKYRD